MVKVKWEEDWGNNNNNSNNNSNNNNNTEIMKWVLALCFSLEAKVWIHRSSGLRCEETFLCSPTSSRKVQTWKALAKCLQEGPLKRM